VRFPLGGHVKAEGARCFDLRWRLHWGREFNTAGTENTEKGKNGESEELVEKCTLFVA
jgi:hypothetical protein